MDTFTCCASPILLASLFLYSLIQSHVPKNPDLAVAEDYQVTHKLAEKRPIIRIASLSTILFAIFCFIWVYFTGWIIYWQLFYLKAILEAIIICTMIATVLVLNKRFQLWGISRVIQLQRTQRDQLGMAFTITGAILWITVTPYIMNVFTLSDSIEIETNTFNLVYIESIESHAHFILYKCGWQSIFCQRVAESKLDYCRSYQSGRLSYDPIKRELSAEMITCFKYTGLTYVIE